MKQTGPGRRVGPVDAGYRPRDVYVVDGAAVGDTRYVSRSHCAQLYGVVASSLLLRRQLE